jgi:hypothetical protein
MSSPGTALQLIDIIESPLTKNTLFAALTEWLPALTGNRLWDGITYGVTFVSFILLCYWLWQ